MSTIVKNIHILKDGVWRPISKVFHQGEWKKMKGIFYDGVWYEIGSTCVVMPEGCAIATNEHPRWDEATYYGTNNFGFNALPGGLRDINGAFYYFGFLGYWWSATESDTYRAWYRSMLYYNGSVDRGSGSEELGFSVRCVKDYTGIEPNGTIISNDYTDGDGNKYDAVVIEEQLWTVKNLHTTKYQDGTNIPNVTNNNDWMYLTTGAYCWYDNDYETYGQHYGALYNWYAIDGLVDNNGYRIPSDSDWTQLTDYLINTEWDNDVITESNVAQFLKSCRQVNHPLADMRFHIDIQEGIHQVKVYRNDNLWVTFNTTQKVSLPAELGDIYRLEITVLSGGISISNHTEGTISYYGNSVDKSFDMHTLPYNITLENTAL